MKRPTIVLGDIHGSTYWKQVIQENPDCKYVFLGDYLDPYIEIDGKDLISNLEDIIEFKRANLEDVALLLGNHDLHYITHKIEQSMRYDYDLAPQAREIFLRNQNLFQFAYQQGNCVFTHAGISQQWFVEDFQGNPKKNIANQLNYPKPEQEDALYAISRFRGVPDAGNGGIFWADARELFEPLNGYTQIVGHNRVNEIIDHVNNGGRIIFCDCLFNKHYLKI